MAFDVSPADMDFLALFGGGPPLEVLGQSAAEPPPPEDEVADSGPSFLSVLLRTAWETYAGEVCEVQTRLAGLTWPAAETQQHLLQELDFMHKVVTGSLRPQLEGAGNEVKALARDAEVSLADFPYKDVSKFAAFVMRCWRDASELVIRPFNSEWQYQRDLFVKMQKAVLARLDSHLNAGASKLGFMNVDGLAASATFANRLDTSPVYKSRMLEADLIFRCVNFSASDAVMSSFGVQVLNSGLYKSYRVCRGARILVVNVPWLASHGASLDQYLASKNAVRVAEPLYLREFPNCVLAWVFPQSSATSFVQNVGVAYWTLDTGA